MMLHLFASKSQLSGNPGVNQSPSPLVGAEEGSAEVWSTITGGFGNLVGLVVGPLGGRTSITGGDDCSAGLEVG
jgi:hypothetical protein